MQELPPPEGRPPVSSCGSSSAMAPLLRSPSSLRPPIIADPLTNALCRIKFAASSLPLNVHVPSQPTAGTPQLVAEPHPVASPVQILPLSQLPRVLPWLDAATVTAMDEACQRIATATTAATTLALPTTIDDKGQRGTLRLSIRHAYPSVDVDIQRGVALSRRLNDEDDDDDDDRPTTTIGEKQDGENAALRQIDSVILRRDADYDGFAAAVTSSGADRLMRLANGPPPAFDASPVSVTVVLDGSCSKSERTLFHDTLRRRFPFLRVGRRPSAKGVASDGILVTRPPSGKRPRVANIMADDTTAPVATPTGNVEEEMIAKGVLVASGESCPASSCNQPRQAVMPKCFTHFTIEKVGVEAERCKRIVADMLNECAAAARRRSSSLGGQHELVRLPLLSPQDVGTAGRKDKQAWTMQRASVPGDWTAFIGSVDEPVRSGGDASPAAAIVHVTNTDSACVLSATSHAHTGLGRTWLEGQPGDRRRIESAAAALCGDDAQEASKCTAAAPPPPIVVIHSGCLQSAPLYVGQLLGNRFEITVRWDIPATASQAESDTTSPRQQSQSSAVAQRPPQSIYVCRAAALTTSGFLNYFGPQRFDARGRMPGMFLLLGDYAGLVAELLLDGGAAGDGRNQSAVGFGSPCDHALSLARQGRYSQAVAALRRCRSADGVSSDLLALMQGLSANHGDTKSAVLSLPYATRVLWLNAVQSFVFNRVLSLRAEKGRCRADHSTASGGGDAITALPRETTAPPPVVDTPGCETVLSPRVGDWVVVISAPPSPSGRGAPCPSQFGNGGIVHRLTVDDINSNRCSVRDLVLPLLGRSTPPLLNRDGPSRGAGDTSDELLCRALDELGLRMDMFAQKDIAGVTLPGDLRSCVAFPDVANLRFHRNGDCIAKEEKEEEEERLAAAATVSLSLPSSAYATVALRAIFGGWPRSSPDSA